MILKLKQYDYGTKAWVPAAKIFSTVSRRHNRGFNLESTDFKYPYGRGGTVAPTCLAKWVD